MVRRVNVEENVLHERTTEYVRTQIQSHVYKRNEKKRRKKKGGGIQAQMHSNGVTESTWKLKGIKSPA